MGAQGLDRMMSNWRFRKGSQADPRVRLKCGCVYNCYDPDKTILRVCDIHREQYMEMVAAGEVLTVENMEKGREEIWTQQ